MDDPLWPPPPKSAVISAYLSWCEGIDQSIAAEAANGLVVFGEHIELGVREVEHLLELGRSLRNRAPSPVNLPPDTTKLSMRAQHSALVRSLAMIE